MSYSRNGVTDKHGPAKTPYRLSQTAIKRWTIALGAVIAASIGVPLIIDLIWTPVPFWLLDALTIVALTGLLAPLAMSAVVGGYAIGPYGAFADGLFGAGIALLVLGLTSVLGWVAAVVSLGSVVTGSIGLIVVGRRNDSHMWIRVAGAKVMERNAPSLILVGQEPLRSSRDDSQTPKR